MILVDVLVPSIGQKFDFELDETVKISGIIEEIASMAGQKVQSEIKGNISELLLCEMQEGVILPKDKTLSDCQVSNGSCLLLV